MIRHLLLAAVLTSFVAGSTAAAPVIDLSWNACSPITHDRVLPAGATSSDLYVITTGMTDATKAYQFQLFMGEEASPTCSPRVVADAWRFDDAGCQGQAGLMNPSFISSKACPALSGSSTGLTIFHLTYDPLDSQLKLVCTNSYPVQASDPNVTYQLVKLHIDHTYAVQGPGDPPNTCGGFEKPMCITLWGGYNIHGDCYGPGHLEYAAYLDGDGNQHSFASGPVDVTSFRIDPGIQACNLATPVTPTTWGAIRGRYR